MKLTNTTPFTRNISLNRLGFLFVILFAAAPLLAQNFDNGFPFQLPYNDSTTQEFLPQFPAFTITENHRITAETDGKFHSDGQPIRFWGVNIGASAVFPPKTEAPIIAARMRKMGINLVRFHHLENDWSGLDGCIFDYAQGTRQLQANTLDRLDFFIAELKKNGIFVNMNLNVSRQFKQSDGVPDADSLQEYAKGVTLYDPWLQFLQREYAQQLLGHTNPYTNLPLASDPVLAMVETNNENSLYGLWKSEALKPILQGGLLTHRHNTMLDSLWNAWLLQKYGTPAALAASWNAGAQPPGSGNIMLNADFEADTLTYWELEQHDVASASITKSTNNPFAGSASVHLAVTNYTGTDWHIQLKQPDLTVKKDSTYVLRFAARCDVPAHISFAVMRDNAPFTWYSGDYKAVNTDWGIHTITFVAPETNNNMVRITISPTAVGNYYFDNFSLGHPTQSGLDAAEDLSLLNIRRIDWSERQLYTNARLQDMAEFYITTQKNHFTDLRNYLKTQLNVLAPITGTNALLGPQDAMLHDNCDYLDDHSYWDHPQFPAGAWDPWNWLINNQPLVRNETFHAITGIFSGLQYANKPYTISEYNHAAPNRFRTEMPHALLAYSAFQGADGLMFFDYNGNNADWSTDEATNFFSLQHDHSIMALFPTCAKAFRDGMVAEGTNPTQINYNPNDIYTSGRVDTEHRWEKYLPYSRMLGLTQKIETASYNAANSTDFQALPPAPSNPYTTSTEETTLNTNSGLLKTITNKFIAISGFLDEIPNTQAGALTLVSGAKFGSLTWVSLTDQPLNITRRSLLTLSTAQQNTDMVWDSTFTVHNQWGNSPTLQSPNIATLHLHMIADTLIVWQLDGNGAKIASQILLPASSNTFEVNIDQNNTNTLWYGIEARGGTSSACCFPVVVEKINIFPNPTFTDNMLTFTLAKASKMHITLLNNQGQVLHTLYDDDLPMGDHKLPIAADKLTAGSYHIRLEASTDGSNTKTIKTATFQVMK